MNRNGRLRVGYFAQHHVETLIPTMNPVQFLASKFPGKTEQEYRSHLGNFQISGMTGSAILTFTTICLVLICYLVQVAVDWDVVGRTEESCRVCRAEHVAPAHPAP